MKSKNKSAEAHNNVSLYFYFSWINAFKKIIIFSLKKILLFARSVKSIFLSLEEEL